MNPPNRNSRRANTITRKPLLPAIFLSATLTLTGGCSSEKTDQEYLQSAVEYIKSGNKQAAIIELKNALQINPENKEARYQLGKLYLASQLGPQAEKEFRKAIEYGYPADELVDELALAYFYQYKFDTLLDGSIRQEHLSPDEKAQTLFLRGMAEIALQRKQDALVDLEESVRTQPNSPYARLSSAYLEALNDNVDKALLKTLDLLKSNPRFAEANIFAAKLYASNKNFAEAVKYQKAATEEEPNRLALYIELARYQAANQEFDEAEKSIDIVLKAAPNHIASNLIKAGLAMQRKDWQTALEHAGRVLAVSEVNKQAKLISGVANFYLQNWSAAREHLKSVAQFVPPSHMVHRMLAYTDFKLGYAQNADDILAAIGQTGEADAALLSQFGTELLKQGDYAEATKLFDRAASIAPESTEAKTKAGILKLQQNNLEGLTDLESVIAHNQDDFWARAGLIRYHIAQKNYNEAEKLARESIETHPDRPDGFQFLAGIFVYQEQFDKAIAVLDDGLAKLPDNPTLLIDKTKALALKGDKKAAEQVIKAALSSHPDDKNILMALYRLKKDEDALDLLRVASERNPKDDSYKLLYALGLLDQGKVEKAENVLSGVPSDSVYYGKAQLSLGNAALRQQNFDKAIGFFEKAIEADPSSKVAYRGLTEAYLKTSKTDEALTTVQKALQQFPTDLSLQLMEIQLLFASDQVNQAEKAAKRFAALNGDNAKLELILAGHAIKKGDVKAATDHFQKAHQISPSTATVIALSQGLKKLDRVDEAKRLLEDWLKSHPKDQPVKMLLANFSLNKDNEEAIRQYRSLVADNPNNIVALNNLAWALGESGNIAEALQYAERAYQLKPVPPVMDTYGFLLFKNGQIEDALPLLEKAHQSLDDPSIAFHYALALKQANKQGDAKAILKAVLDKDFPERDQARALFDSL